jgi:hypothetical protein
MEWSDVPGKGAMETKRGFSRDRKKMNEFEFPKVAVQLADSKAPYTACHAA